MLLHVSFIAIILLVAWAFHRYQLVSDHLLPFMRRKFPRMNSYVALQSFEGQRSQGLSSSNFDLEADNIRAGDSRMGLDEVGAAEVHRIMSEESVSFDDARLRRHQRLLARNGIDPTGMPTDSKAITRL
ncbi:hypothetical protein BDY24DRAFT_397170 [Mrakia frigida]|uniref:uncharacterized protein n=1 Tax=Mrakia frigida TaxID=29902 RepID=UPI003FCBF1FD